MRSVPFILAIATFLSVCRAADAQTDPADQDISKLITQLSDTDSALRKSAADKLQDIGMPARPQILKAARSDDPEQSAQAARILRKLPWWTSHDSPETRALLERYGESNDPNRMAIVRRIEDLNGTSTLLRLLREEPSDTVRWFMVGLLVDQFDDSIYKTFRENPPDANDAPLQVITGFAWRERDREKSNACFQQAVDLEAIRPTNDDGILSAAVTQLVSDAIESLDFNRAAELLRKQVPRELGLRHSVARTPNMFVPDLIQLVALHEYAGPLDHFAWDARTWSIVPTHPTLLASLVGHLGPLGFTAPLPVGLTRDFDALQHDLAAEFLWVECSLPDAAEAELRTGLAHMHPRVLSIELTMLAFLSELTAARDDDAETVKLLTYIFDHKGGNPLEPLPGHGDVLPDHRTEDDLRAELHFRTARIAQAAGQTAKADREVDELLNFVPTNTDSAIKMVVWLKETNRTPQARKLFTRVYDIAVAHANDHPGHPTLQNDLAWLCARCGENLDKAVEYGESAVKEAPNISAFLDTLAEAKYRTGHADEAIKLETKALELSPDAKFMKEQIARFKSGKP